MVLIPLSVENAYSPAGLVPLPSHLTSCTPAAEPEKEKEVNQYTSQPTL
jgi:hypothetical protein